MPEPPSTAARPAAPEPPSVVAAPPPTETPPGEGSTTEGISVPEPPELRRAWGPWPLVIIAVLVLAVVVFLVARVAA